MLSFCDLHVHLGKAAGKPVKVTASSSLTLSRALDYAEHFKGLQVMGIIDAACSGVLQELKLMLSQNNLSEKQGGGFSTPSGFLVIPGAEWEMEIKGARVHLIAFFPGIESLEAFNSYLRKKVSNPGLSTQFLRDRIHKVFPLVGQLGGFLGFAHAFTPFKGFFGQLDSLEELGEFASKIKFLELGLSADSNIADGIAELHSLPFIVGSDAHSFQNIGREYLEIDTPVKDFGHFFRVVSSGEGIRGFRGFPPALGKYYQTRCRHCGFNPGSKEEKVCPRCLQQGLIQGVSDRIARLSKTRVQPPERPPYFPHLPLHLLPGFGPKTIEKLYEKLGTELDIIHRVPPEKLARILDSKGVELILSLRRGELGIESGGAGQYGKVKG